MSLGSGIALAEPSSIATAYGLMTGHYEVCTMPVSVGYGAVSSGCLSVPIGGCPIWSKACFVGYGSYVAVAGYACYAVKRSAEIGEVL